MSATDSDMGLEAFLSAAREQSPTLNEALIRAAYKIQINHQFDKDRVLALQELEKLVEHYANNLDKSTD